MVRRFAIVLFAAASLVPAMARAQTQGTAAKGAQLAPSERVLVLRFRGAGGDVTSAQLDAARAATVTAVGQLRDIAPSDAEVAAGEREVKDGVADTSAEYRAAGHAATAAWTVAAQVDMHGWTYRLELEVCQVSSGRVESLAREVDARQAAPQIAEMLALLLRPQGVGDAVPPWDQPSSSPTPVPSAAPPPAAAPAPAAAPPSSAPVVPPQVYAENLPFALGLGGAVLDAFQRASDARGSATAGMITAHGAYGIQGVFHGLELVADAGIAVAGPSSFGLDAGARYELAIVPSARIFVGPEVKLGVFLPLGGDKDARLMISGSLPIVVGVTERLQIEAYPELAYAAGGTASLALVGGGLRGVLRF